MKIENRLAVVRRRRGLSAAELAKRVGVTRQTVHAIESGAYVPNTVVSLQFARELDVAVEELFTLSPGACPASVLSASENSVGQPMRISQVGDQWIGVPSSPFSYFLPDADGVATRVESVRADVRTAQPDLRNRLVIAGCDPAIGILASAIQTLGSMEAIAAPASSRLALEWLKKGKVHVAGTHLEDERTGEFNVPYIRQYLPREEMVVITFASWEEGFVVARGNPLYIHEPADLFRPDVRIRNRELGSASRILLDRVLRQSGGNPATVNGCGSEALGHLAVAHAITAGEADCCLAASSAARAFGLDFIPLATERFDLVLRRAAVELPAIRVMMDVLHLSTLRRKLDTLAGYDTTNTGSMVKQ